MSWDMRNGNAKITNPLVKMSTCLKGNVNYCRLLLFVICLWVLGFDSFKEWTDDKLTKFCKYCQGMGLFKESRPFLGVKNVSRKLTYC